MVLRVQLIVVYYLKPGRNLLVCSIVNDSNNTEENELIHHSPLLPRLLVVHSTTHYYINDTNMHFNIALTLFPSPQRRSIGDYVRNGRGSTYTIVYLDPQNIY